MVHRQRAAPEPYSKTEGVILGTSQMVVTIQQFTGHPCRRSSRAVCYDVKLLEVVLYYTTTVVIDNDGRDVSTRSFEKQVVDVTVDT